MRTSDQVASNVPITSPLGVDPIVTQELPEFQRCSAGSSGHDDAEPSDGRENGHECPGRGPPGAAGEATRVPRNCGDDVEDGASVIRRLRARASRANDGGRARHRCGGDGKLDIDAGAIVIDGKVHRRVLRQSQTYETSAGEVVVERTLYKDRSDQDGRCVSPMELTLGIVGDFWTPRAAQQALWVVTQMTPKKSAELFERVGNMTPSKSSLDRLPKLVSERWEERREDFERVLREGFEIPEGSVSIALSLDGVLAPIDGANRPTEVRAEAAADGRLSKGPAGYREASCATLSFCDDKGDLLGAIRLARAPETKKATLKKMLAAEVAAVLLLKPTLKVMKVADGAADNWEYLSSEALPKGDEAVDFFHASEHLHAALANVYGDGTHQTRFRHETLRETLRDEEGGADKVIRALQAPRDEAPPQGSRKARTFLLPETPKAHELRRAEGERFHDWLGCRRSRLQDPRHTTHQAERHALERARCPSDPHAARMGPE